ncbi:unnamed protein product [Gordionus sp. m RMFG-2023]|uniref:uncharacterized protein DDB_G0271670-like n=1 Tax=Gordionus sp. m RMFG-2023 TaxID=3053472 RepID=UPI0030DF8DDC
MLNGSNKGRKSGFGISDIVGKFNKDIQVHARSQLLNPFSSSYDPDFATACLPDKNDSQNYGHPIQGSKTEMRAHEAQKHIQREVELLTAMINRKGTTDERNGLKCVKFGDLFKLYAHISDKLVGILLRARKQGLVAFQGEMLYQRRDEEQPIYLLYYDPVFDDTQSISNNISRDGSQPHMAGGKKESIVFKKEELVYSFKGNNDIAKEPTNSDNNNKKGKAKETDTRQEIKEPYFTEPKLQINNNGEEEAKLRKLGIRNSIVETRKKSLRDNFDKHKDIAHLPVYKSPSDANSTSLNNNQSIQDNTVSSSFIGEKDIAKKLAKKKGTEAKVKKEIVVRDNQPNKINDNKLQDTKGGDGESEEDAMFRKFGIRNSIVETRKKSIHDNIDQFNNFDGKDTDKPRCVTYIKPSSSRRSKLESRMIERSPSPDKKLSIQSTKSIHQSNIENSVTPNNTKKPWYMPEHKTSIISERDISANLVKSDITNPKNKPGADVHDKLTVNTKSDASILASETNQRRKSSTATLVDQFNNVKNHIPKTAPNINRDKNSSLRGSAPYSNKSSSSSSSSSSGSSSRSSSSSTIRSGTS